MANEQYHQVQVTSSMQGKDLVDGSRLKTLIKDLKASLAFNEASEEDVISELARLMAVSTKGWALSSTAHGVVFEFKETLAA